MTPPPPFPPGAHVTDDLPRLLTGDADRAEVTAAAAHLRECADCRDDLVGAVVAHAALSSARRFAPELVQLAAATPSGPGDRKQPDLSAVFAQVRAEAAAEDVDVAARSAGPADLEQATRRPVARWVLAGAAAALVVGGSTAAVVVESSGSGGSGRTTAVALRPFGVGTVAAAAKVDAKGRMTLTATDLPALDAKHRYEVWLTDDARTRMQPIGWLGADGVGHLTVPGDLMASYADIEVSVQQVDAPTYDYSGTSVLRGSY